MKIIRKIPSIIRFIWLRIRHRKVITDYRKYCVKKHGHALIYYKTAAFTSRFFVERHRHPGDWMVLEMARVLNKLGFWVDILDRSVESKDLDFLEDKYDVFIGLGTSDSGKLYPEIASRVKKAKKILFVNGQAPKFFNERAADRYDYFETRHPKTQLIRRRMVTKIDIKKVMEITDTIFCIGNDHTIETYAEFNKPMHRIYPSVSPKICFDISQLSGRSPRKFLYFGGNGNILKGLDLVLEAFLGLPDLELFVCAPGNEEDFNEVYRDVLSRAPNIHMMGIIPVGEKIFNELTSACGYIVFPSSTEGTATSVLTCMRGGLVPAVTVNSGIDVEFFGYLIEDPSVESIQAQMKVLAEISSEELRVRSLHSYLASLDYTQSEFSQSFERALLKTLEL